MVSRWRIIVSLPPLLLIANKCLLLLKKETRITLDSLDDILPPTVPFPEEDGAWKLTRKDFTDKDTMEEVTIMTWTVRWTTVKRLFQQFQSAMLIQRLLSSNWLILSVIHTHDEFEMAGGEI